MSISHLSISNNDSQDRQLESVVSFKDKYDIVATIVAPIFLLISLSLIIHYGIYPSAPMVSINPSFSISLPLIICSGIGLIIGVIFVIQLVRLSQVKVAFEKSMGQLIHSSESVQGQIRYILHPGKRENGQRAEDYVEANSEFIEEIETAFGPAVTFITRDNVSLRGYWHESQRKDAPTAIIFHGNAMNAEDLIPSWGEVYRRLGFNVLSVEYRGYGISEGQAGGPNQEMEAYLDAEAALKFVLSQGVERKKILAHGYSLGGVYATALGYFFGVQHVVLDHTFTTAAAVASHVAPISQTMAARAIAASYEKKSMDRNSTIPNAKPLVTDSFNSLAKVQKMPGEVLVIRGEEDKLMDMSFGDAFVRAKYPNDDEMQNEHLATVSGGHCDLNNFFNNQDAWDKFEEFLLVRGLL